MKLRNWIEKAIGKQLRWPPVCVGKRGGRKVYCIEFMDGTEDDYYINFEEKTIEKI